MIVGGARQLWVKRAMKAAVGQILLKQEDLWKRLLAREPLDRIAEDFYRNDRIPPIRTLQVAGYLIREMQEQDSELASALAAYLTADQIVDSDLDPEEGIDRFSFHDDVYYVEDTAFICRKVSSFGHTPGTLILNKGFLYFFERSRWRLVVTKILAGLGGDIPILGVAAAGYELVGELSQELAGYFDIRRKATLRERFRKSKSRAYPLVEIEEIELRQKRHIIGATQFVEVRGRSSEGDWQCLFSSSELQDRDWGSLWMQRLQIGCIGEGNLLEREE